MGEERCQPPPPLWFFLPFLKKLYATNTWNLTFTNFLLRMPLWRKLVLPHLRPLLSWVGKIAPASEVYGKYNRLFVESKKCWLKKRETPSKKSRNPAIKEGAMINTWKNVFHEVKTGMNLITKVFFGPIRQDGRKSRKLYAVPNKRTNPANSWKYSTSKHRVLPTFPLLFIERMIQILTY